MDKKVNEKKKRYAIIISFLVLMVCITGGTYAYFALTASNNSVTGSVGGASLNLEVTKVYPTSEHNSKNMIPQLESTLDEAISLEHKCVDGNGNVICQVYSATVTNQGSTTSVLNGTISFTGIENMPNLKWMRINDSNTLGTYSSYIASTDKALFEEEKSFSANESSTYYFVFWINETEDIQYDNGEFEANIEFNSSGPGLTSTLDLLLNEVEVGSYVKYVGNNGCEGDSCSGINANSGDASNGYCNGSSAEFSVSGWRVAYINNESAHLISAGSPECVQTYVDYKDKTTSSGTLSKAYRYGSSYTFDDNTGYFTLNNATYLSWSSNLNIIINTYKYTCNSGSSTTCKQLYEISSRKSSTEAYYYLHYNYLQDSRSLSLAGNYLRAVDAHDSNLANKSLKYCNANYAKNGICDRTTAWGMNLYDYEKITGNKISSSSCFDNSTSLCGLGNDLIDNGGMYWIAGILDETMPIVDSSFAWNPNDRSVILYTFTIFKGGLRPVLSIDPSVKVIGGKGTEEDPYIIFK